MHININTMTKSHIPAAAVPRKIDILNENSENIFANVSKIRKKRGRPAGSMDKNPRKTKIQNE